MAKTRRVRSPGVASRIDDGASRTVRFLESLIRVATVNPPGERYEECIALLDRRLRNLGLKTQVLRVPDALVARTLPDSAGHPRYNLVGRLETGARRTVHFNAHYDVVPVSGGWSTKGPFKPQVRDGWLYGRGSADMKGSIASLCAALEALRSARVLPAVNVEVSFTADEEVGGELGAGWLVREGHVHADFAIECEGGGKDRIGCGHNGVAWFRVALNGKPAHAAAPHRGVNAFEAAAEVVRGLTPLKRRLSKRTFRTPTGRAMHPTVNVGGVFGTSGGAKVNTVPADAWFTIDRRIVPSERLRDAERELVSALKGARPTRPRVRMKTEVFQRIDPCVSDTETAFHRGFAAAVREVRGSRPRFGITPGFTDLHWFVHDLGLPGLGYGAGGERGHGVDERAKIEDILATAKVYARFLEDFDGS